MHRYAVFMLLLLVGVACDPQESPMPQQATYSAKGLYTYPNPFSEIPDGAFSRADDVVIRRPGYVETRRGFAPLAATFGASGDRIRSLHDFGGTLVAHTSANKLVRYSGGAWTEYSGTYTPPDSRRMRFLNAGDSLYFTTDAGVYRLDEVSGTPLQSGVPQAVGGTAALDSNGAHATGTVTLAGSAGNVTVTVNGTAVGPVTYAGSDTATATAVKNALNANGTVAALVTATANSTVITLTAVNGGTAGNAITLTASRTAGSATASGATLTGGSDGSGWLPADSQTAYRFVWGYRNANDRLILGAPSGRLPLTNPSTETLDTVTLTVPIPSWVTTDYFLQVYRADTSGSATIPASDDMALTVERYPTASEVSVRSMTVEDITPDELKGASLYSSPNSGVPGSEKFEPPVCTDLAYYKERMWCSSTVQRQRVLLTLLSVDSSSGGLQTGDYITLTSGATTETYVGNTTESLPNQFKITTAGTASQNVAETAQSLARCITSQLGGIARAFYVSGEYDNPGQILIEARDLGASAITIKAGRRGRVWVPAITTILYGFPVSRAGNVTTVTVASGVAELSVGKHVVLTGHATPFADSSNFPTGTYTITAVNTGANTFTYTDNRANASATDTIFYEVQHPPVTTDPSDAPNGLASSEYAEPDAVPLGDYLQVGASNHDVLRIIPLGDTLFVFKEEGIFIVTGDSPESFSAREFSVKARLMAPESAVAVGSRIFALTDQGVMAISETGAQVVSRPIEGTLAPYYSGNAAMQAATSTYAFGVGYETEREYWLFLPSDSSSTYAEEAYVYNYATQAWTHWTVDATTGYVLPGADVAYMGSATSNTANVERKSRTSADYQDANDVAITSRVDWAVRTGGDPSTQKQWRKVTALFETPAPEQVALYLSTELSTTPESGWFTTDGLPYVTSYVPLEKARSQVLTVGVQAGEVGKVLALQGLAVEFTSSNKVR